MDLSSEIYHALLPAFLTVTLGLPVVAMGALDGVAEATANMAKLVSGRLSDRNQRRKPWILLGYGMAALSKPLFPLAQGVIPVFGARFVDRIGKGIRGAPRDAMIADETPPELRGSAYGLRQALDTVGAFLAPLAAARGPGDGRGPRGQRGRGARSEVRAFIARARAIRPEFEADEIAERLEVIATREAELATSADHELRFHSGPP